MIACRIVVRGRVQGVGFRESMIAAAQAAGVEGWVRNCRDGTVEAIAQGDPGAVERLIVWCRRGPPAARVEAVEVTPIDHDPGHTDFVRRPTH